MTTEPLRLFWQPGCTSCLKAKEFLSRHGIAYKSINVRASAEAMAALEALGARSVPVIARGGAFCFAQELDDVARFLGLDWKAERLPVATLIERVQSLLRVSERLARQMPNAAFETPIQGRPDRTFGDIPFHIAMIVEGFLDAAKGDALTFQHFERRAEGASRTPDGVAHSISETAARFAAWRAHGVAPEQSLRTYYGTQPLPGVLERTAWHVAQHARQLEHIIRGLGLAPAAALGAPELAGLPLPEGVWDKEVG